MVGAREGGSHKSESFSEKLPLIFKRRGGIDGNEGRRRGVTKTFSTLTEEKISVLSLDSYGIPNLLLCAWVLLASGVAT